MLEVKRLLIGMMATNTYLVTNTENKETIIIDPADKAHKIEKYITENELKPKAILLTHGHFDHIKAVDDIKKIYNIKCYTSKEEIDVLQNADINLSTVYGEDSFVVYPDILLNDGEVIEIAGYKIKVILTPGHTKGGLCYYFIDENIMFTGDTLFKGTIGRYDFPTGSYEDLIKSINEKIINIDENCIIYPGHGFESTILLEKQSNPYMDRKEEI